MYSRPTPTRGAGRLLEQPPGLQTGAEFTYDLAGNRTRIQTSGGATQKLAYDTRWNIVGVEDSNQNRKTRVEYDLLNREIRRIEKDGGVQRTVYDRNGQVVRLIRPDESDAQTDSGDGFQFTYDAQGRVLTVLSPDGQVFQGNTCNTKDIMMPVA